MQIATVKHALDNAPYCGDECGYWKCGVKTILCIVDGLGHGKDAEIAAKAAVNYISCHLSESLQEIFTGCDRELRGTRGAAMGITVINAAKDELTYAGIGNTRVIVVNSKTFHLDSDYGIIGGGFKKLIPETLAICKGALVIMFTDGVEELVDLSRYDLISGDVHELAEKIITDWRIERDDAAVMVYRIR
ncbi:MAG: SpoIIE family protein phosphatase [Euryarchaeota archaeon]|nr:SpoIIE family protein phosphatase [Euryarchaeota archaeon]